MAEARGTGAIPDELSVILVDHFRTVRKDGAALTSDKRSDRGIHSFLVQIASGLDLIPGLEEATLVRVDPAGMVYLLHSLLFVQVCLYLTSQSFFAYWGELPVKVLPPVVEIPHKALVERRSIRTVPRVRPVTHMG